MSRHETIEEILRRWTMDEDPEIVRVLQYIAGLEARYGSLLRKLEDITNRVNDLNRVVPDEDTIEQIVDIQDNY